MPEILHIVEVSDLDVAAMQELEKLSIQTTLMDCNWLNENRAGVLDIFPNQLTHLHSIDDSEIVHRFSELGIKIYTSDGVIDCLDFLIRVGMILRFDESIIRSNQKVITGGVE